MNSLKEEPNTTVMPLCYLGHPALKRKSVDVTEITDEIMELAEAMINTMKANDGIGLAGAQIGRNINLIVLDIPTSDGKKSNPGFTSPGEMSLLPMMPLVLVNPKLSNFSEKQVSYDEGCLSIPGITAEVVRSEYIQLEAKLLNGQQVSYRCGGLLARCLQHECDHLNGILFIELLPPEIRESIDRSLEELKEFLKSEKLDRHGKS